MVQGRAHEICSKFHMVQNRALSNSARHSSWYKIGRCRVQLVILHDTELGADFELLDLLHGTALGPVEFA